MVAPHVVGNGGGAEIRAGEVEDLLAVYFLLALTLFLVRAWDGWYSIATHLGY